MLRRVIWICVETVGAALHCVKYNIMIFMHFTVRIFEVHVIMICQPHGGETRSVKYI